MADFSKDAISILEKRYLLRDKDGNITETPDQLLRRVAKCAASAETTDELKAEWEEKFYGILDRLEFLPNSPALMNSGTKNQMLFACFVLTPDDDMDSISDTQKNMTKVFKLGGGVGVSFSRLRSSKATVKTSGGTSSGPVSFMKAYDGWADAVKQGGKRRGAAMGALRVDHPDIEDFITAKKVEGTLSNFNISVAITDKFMEAVKEDDDYFLVEPHNKQKHKPKIKARKIWDMIVNNAWISGDPGVLFIDTINKHNQTAKLGPIEVTNPCVTFDTLLSTGSGMYRIGSLLGQGPQECVVDNRALGDSYGTSLRQATEAFQTSPREKIYRVTTEAGYSVKVTSYHELYTDRGKLKLKEINVGDNLWISSGEGGFGNFGTRELGFFLGFWFGDGAFHINQGRVEAAIRLYGEKQELAGRIMEQANAMLEDSPSLNGQDYGDLTWNIKPDSMSLESIRLARSLENLGITEKKIPDWLFSASKECVAGFLEGLFASDGTVNITYRNKSCSLKLGSVDADLLRDVQILLVNFGIFSRLYENRKEACVKFMPDGKGGLKEYPCQGFHELYINAASSRDLFVREIGLGRTKHVNKYSTLTPQKVPYKQRWTSKIRSIEFVGEEPTYCITQNDKNTVVFNGVVSGQCGETPLPNNGSCVLGSMNLTKFVHNGNIDYDKLNESTAIAVRFLDNIIDVNAYPLPQIEEVTKRDRRIGLGVMGLADILIDFGIPYASDKAASFVEELFSRFSESQVVATERLAAEKGAFPSFADSSWKDGKKRRNATVSVVAPTGTISMLAGVSSGVEPIFSSVTTKTVMDDTDFVTIHPKLKAYLDKHRISKKRVERFIETGNVDDLELPEEISALYRGANDIGYAWHVKMQSIIQKYIELSVSKTINLPNHATKEDVSDAIMMAYESGCKGVTVFRDGCKSVQVLTKGTSKLVGGSRGLPGDSKDSDFERPEELPGKTYKVRTSECGNLFVTVNSCDGKDDVCEVICELGKAGDCQNSFLEWAGRLISIALQNGVPADKIIKHGKDLKCPKSTFKKSGMVHSCADAVSQCMARYMEDARIADKSEPRVSKLKCPTCGSDMITSGGCATCTSCGNSSCGGG